MTNFSMGIGKVKEVELPMEFERACYFKPGGLNRTDAIRTAYLETIKRYANRHNIKKGARPSARQRIAQGMSVLLGCEVNLNHINSWASKAKGSYRIPFEYVTAFCVVTSDWSILHAAFSDTGIHVINDGDKLRLDIFKNEEMKNDLAKRVKKDKARLEQLKKRQG